jgi:hypothetical protein
MMQFQYIEGKLKEAISSSINFDLFFCIKYNYSSYILVSAIFESLSEVG